MNPTNTFNRYRQNNFAVNINHQHRFNPIADLSIPNNTTVMYPMRTLVPQQPTLTNSLNKEILATLKNREKELVEEVNYYQNLDRHGTSKEIVHKLNETLGKNKSRLIRGESYAQELAQTNQTLMPRNQSMGAIFAGQKKKEDFLDRFIK